jgi:hypothetical protein
MLVAERDVVMVTAVGAVTVNGSHALVAPALFTSPLYTAFQLNVPAVGKA